MSGFWTCLKRELALAFKRSGDLLTVLLFFVITISLFPFGLGTEKALLQEVAPSVIWVVAILALLLSITQLFGRDEASGVTDQILLSPTSSLEFSLAKWLANWITTALPQILVTPVLSLLYFLPGELTLWLMLSLAIGTPALTSLGLIASALSLGARQSAMLIPLLALPLMVPVVIFGLGAVKAVALQSGTLLPWYALAALSLGLLPLSILVSGFALRSRAG